MIYETSCPWLLAFVISVDHAAEFSIWEWWCLEASDFWMRSIMVLMFTSQSLWDESQLSVLDFI